MSEQLEKIIEQLPIIHVIAGTDRNIVVYDAEGYIKGYVLPTGVQPVFSIGDRFDDVSGGFERVLKTGKTVHNVLPAEVMGEPYEGDLIPIFEGGQIVGIVASTYCVTGKTNILNTVDRFKEDVSAIREKISSVSVGMEGLSGELGSANDMTGTIEDDVKNSVKIVGKVSSNASNSNILALNASIEAARSGEAGRGFAVVATEMGHLAKDSGSAAGEIKASLETMKEHLQSVLSSIKVANDGARQQLESVKEVVPVLDDILALADVIEANV